MDTQENTKQKLILVTGGAGFIGSHLCEALALRGHRVISLDNYFTGSIDNHVPGVEYRKGHTKDIELYVPETPDLVYHLGEYSRVEKSFEDVALVWNLNKVGTLSVLEFCRKRNAKIIYAGSSTKFGDGGLGRDQSPYAWSKSSNTELVKNYGEWFGLLYAITYFYNVYGPRERSDSFGTLIAIFKEQYTKGLPFTVVSPGTQKRNFTNVADIVDGLLHVGFHGLGDDFGIGNPQAYSVLEVAQMFNTEIVMLPERKGNRQTASIDTTKTERLGWKANVGLKEHLQEFIKTAGTRSALADKRVLVFSTTFHPISGPAEDALCELMRQMPDIHFDIIAAMHSPAARGAVCPTQNGTIYHVGRGHWTDKYLLPFLGYRIGKKLYSEHNYLFAWSLMASYAAFAAALTKRATGLPLLVTLADQRIGTAPWYKRFILRFIVRKADQVYASNDAQAESMSRMLREIRPRNRLIGAGDAFMNQIRFAYQEFLDTQKKSNAQE